MKNYNVINRTSMDIGVKKKFNFKWLLLSIILSIASINTAWATKTAIPANTVIYVDITNFHDDSHTENNATDSKYYISKPNYWNVYNNRSTSATSTDGAGSYWPTGDSTWLELSVVSGNIYCAKTTDKWYDGNISFWTKNESTYGQVYEACVALMQEYDGTNNLYTISSGSNYHSDRHATCFGTDVSVMPTFKAGRTLYLNADTYWDVDKAIFRAYFFNGVDNTWATCTQVGSTHYYSVTVPDGSWTHVIFVRKDPSTNVENSWTGKWNQTSDMAPSGMNNCVNITAGGDNNQSWGDYAPTPAIAGSMNNWAPDANVMSAGSVGIELDGGKAYAFQIVSGTTWYGSPDSQYKITCVGQDQTFNPTPSDKHILLLTAGDGTYTFHWDGTDLTIDYPDVTHPSTDYVYFKDNEGWHESYFTAHLWGGDISTAWATLPVLTSFNFDGTDYYFTALGGNTDGLVSKGSTSSDDEKTADLNLDDHMGQWYDVVNKKDEGSEVAANWKDFTATLTLSTGQGETTNPSPTSVTVTYGKATNINTDVISTSPAKTGYTFGGYYTAAGGSGTQIINTSEKIPSDLSGYTTSGKWTKTGSSVSATLYAKWTQNITLNQNSATTSGSTSLAATYNAVLDASGITNPVKTNYDFGGWTNGSGGSGDVVINASKEVQTVASWTDSDKKWKHAGSSTLYAKWTEHPYTVTATAGEGGSVGSASYTGKVVTTCAISATPNTGYKFSHWSIESGSVTFADQYSASTTINATSDAEIKANFVYQWSIAGSWLNYPETENWDADTYAMGNITQVSSDYVCSVAVTLDANTNYTFKVVDRAESPYEYWGNNTTTYYINYSTDMSSGWTFGNDEYNTAACGLTTAGAGSYTFTWNITQSKLSITYPNSYTVTFGYGTGGSSVTASVEDAGSISSGDYATAGKDITFTKTATNLAYTFKGWYNASSDGDAISCMASDDVYDDIAANISVYAQFKTRYGLHGSLSDDSESAGMPGWESDGADFTVVGYTDIGEGTGKGVDLECSRTLEPNKEYKFRVQDRAAGSRWGLSESAVLPAEAPGNNVKLNVYGDVSGKDVKIETVGYGTYTFKITNMYNNGDGKYYPAIQVDRPASSQLTLGWKHFTNGALSDGDTGGTVTAATNEGSGFAITNDQFYANGSNLTFTAAPATGYHVEGWYSDASCETAYVDGSGGADISGDGDVILTLSGVSTNTTVYAKFAENVITPTGSGDWDDIVGSSTLTDVVTIDGTITVDVAHAKAKRVILDQSAGGKAGKLVISADKGLEVAEGIWIKKSTGLVAPTAEDLVLESSEDGNATLIFNNSNGTAATVGMYSIASVDGSTWNWQYMASPYASANALHNYYGSYLYSWGNGDGSTTGWFPVPNGGSVDPFVAYCITNKTAGSYYQMDGTLVATDGNNQTISVPEGKSWVVGNSWTAPIQIGQLEEEDFTGLLQNVYLYNTGMDEDGEATMSEDPTGDARYAANTYVSIPIHSAPYSGISVVSSLQGFYVKDDPSEAGGGTLTLNYAKHVRTNGVGSIQNGAMHAPKRVMAENNEPNVLKIKVCGSKYDDRLVLLERADFSMGYDAGWDGDKMGNVAASPRITVEREDGTSDAVSAVPDFEGLTISYRAANTDSEQTLYFEYSDETDPLYIVDVTNNEYIRVMTGNSYTFSTLDNEEHQRFILTRYGAPAITTGVDEVHNVSSARKQMIDGALYIIREGRIYNAEGALVR